MTIAEAVAPGVEAPHAEQVSASCAVTVLPLPFKPSRLSGLSKNLLLSHYENNYGGALRRFNVIERELNGADWSTLAGYAINGLKREALIAANSIILHETYFDNLGGDGVLQGNIAGALERDFGSAEKWRSEFVAMGKALAGGSGWTILAYSPRLGRLFNSWSADHAHTLADGVPVLALDMYEHSYHLDFGANAAAYVDAFMKNIHWTRVSARYEKAVRGEARSESAAATHASSIAVEELRALLEKADGQSIVLDVRLPDDFAAGKDVIASASHRDPQRLAEWKDELANGKPVFVYCAYGFEVGQGVAASLSQLGINARFVCGGIAAWHAIGGSVDRKPEPVTS